MLPFSMLLSFALPYISPPAARSSSSSLSNRRKKQHAISRRGSTLLILFLFLCPTKRACPSPPPTFPPIHTAFLL
ncbi:hypothetical protein DFJ73DRAFT_401487 [Zopfochytrium polystomum]|nr:hypothetical protein DFJ73DRAFT_401487 [Zopfochytrium polystomum]